MDAQPVRSKSGRSTPAWKILILSSVISITVGQGTPAAIAQTGEQDSPALGKALFSPSGSTKAFEPPTDRSAPFSPEPGGGRDGGIRSRFNAYTPPPDRSAPGSTGTGGTRSGGCTGGSPAAFTALAPLSHIGQSAAARPTFSWYVPDRTAIPIDFRLYQYNPDGRLQPRPIYQTEIFSTAGMMSFTLPSSEPELRVGERYYWRASLICDPNHGSEDLIVGAEIKIVEDTIPESERWYDLLQTTLNGNAANPANSLLSELAELERREGEALAQSAGTAGDRSELQERSEEVLQHSENLIQIVEAEP